MKPLSPIMAVVLAASVGVFPLRALATDGAAPANTVVIPTGVSVADADTGTIGAMARILKDNPAARADAGKRISEFMLEEFSLKNDPAKRSFVSPDVDATLRGQISAVATEWGTTTGTPDDVAVLYFVIGPGAAAPSWAPAAFKPDMQWLGKLRFLLTDKGAGDWTGASQIRGAEVKSQATAFLNFAVQKSWSALDPRTQGEVDASVEQNNNTAAAVPDGTRSDAARLAASQQYTVEDLYVNGAKVVDVSGPKDPHSRKISVKIYSKWVDGVIVNEIGIFDLTDSPADVFGQRFPYTPGKKSFVLDDRTPGHKKYELTIGSPDRSGNMEITFARPGDGGVPLKTSGKDLFERRADQAAALNNIVNVGGQEFYVVPQGGAKSGLALFPRSVIEGRGTGDPQLLEPALFSEVGQRGPNGRNQNIPGKRPLGKIGDKEYHLAFNAALGVWEAKEGPGDPPPAPPAPAGSQPGSQAAGGNTPGWSAASGFGGVSIAQLESDLMADQNQRCRVNPDDTKDLAANLKGQYGIAVCSSAAGIQQVILVPFSESVPGQMLRYGNQPGFVLQRARFFDHFLILQFDKQIQYLDLLKQDKDGSGKETGFALSGFIVDKNATKFTDAGALVDAMKTYMGVAGSDAGAFTEVPARVARLLAGKTYQLSAAFAANALVSVGYVPSEDKTYGLWPTVIMPETGAAPASGAGATPTPYSSLGGPANAMDGAVSSVDDAYRADFPTADQRVAKLVGGNPADAETKGVALYEVTDPIGKDTEKKYLLSFKYKAMDPDNQPKIFRQKYIEVFNTANPHPGAGLRMQGLLTAPVMADRVASGYKYIGGSNRERGVLAVFQNRSVSAGNAKAGPANCLGPVIWWGIGAAEAQKACEEDKF